VPHSAPFESIAHRRLEQITVPTRSLAADDLG
jgi:hypothetical protein